MVVHLWHGQTEAHFHFFVVVTLCALYEEWVPYCLAFLYVVLHHTVMGVLTPTAVYSHGGNPLFWAGVHGGFILALGAANTITWRLNEDARAETLRASAEFRSAFDDAPTGMVLTTLDGHIERVNATFLTITGHEGEDLAGRPLTDFASLLRQGGDEVTFTRADGSTGWALWRQSVVRDGEGEPKALVTHMLDISVRKEVESQLDHQAHHDELTGLPNRTLFSEKLAEALDLGAAAVLSSTSTSSRSSTTRSGTPRATSCSSSSPSACAMRCAPATRSPASAATSSRSCCPASTTRTSRPASRTGSPRRSTRRSRSRARSAT